VNKFSKKLQKWQNEVFHIDKFNNFNGCELVVGVRHPQFNEIRADVDENGSFIRYKGYGPLFNFEISKNLNYKYVYNFFNALKRNISTDFDFQIFGTSWRAINLEKNHSFSTSQFTTIDDIILISRFKPHTPFEKIFLPFEVEVWYWLIGTLTVFAVAICIFKCTPTSVQKFVFGSKVTTPFLNML
jgi:hypothetical protein